MEYTYSDELYHYGRKGMKWGRRLYQNEDGSLTVLGRSRYRREQVKIEKKDMKWARRNSDKITRKAEKMSSKELKSYQRELLRLPGAVNKNGKLSASTINAYNRRMAELMNQNVSGLTAPSGKVVSFVAKRGEIGVHMALSTAGYDMSQLKNGVYSSGKIAYRKNNANMMNI